MDSVGVMMLRKAIKRIIFNAETRQDIEKNCAQIISIVEDIVANSKEDATKLLGAVNNIKNDLET